MPKLEIAGKVYRFYFQPMDKIVSSLIPVR